MILSVVVLTGFALWSGVELQTHTNTFIAIPNDRIRCLLYDWGGLRKMTLRFPQGWRRIHLVSMFSQKGPQYFLSGNPRTAWNPASPTTFLESSFQSQTEKRKSFVETFSNTNPGVGGRVLFEAHTFSSQWLSAELTQKKWKEGGRRRGREMEGFRAQCLSVSFPPTRRSSSSARAQPHGGPGSTLLVMGARIIGYAHHRRKPFCLALIPSGSFTFWRIEKNELKIKIISLIWLHLRFMAAAFKGNWKKPTAEFTSVPFLVFQYFINVTSKVNLWGH